MLNVHADADAIAVDAGLNQTLVPSKINRPLSSFVKVLSRPKYRECYVISLFLSIVSIIAKTT